MARLSDLPKVFSSVGVVGFARRVWAQVVEDNLFTWAAALAYSWLFAVFPFLIFLLTLLPYLPTGAKDRAEIEIHDIIYTTTPSVDSADVIWTNVKDNIYNLLHRKENKLLPRL